PFTRVSSSANTISSDSAVSGYRGVGSISGYGFSLFSIRAFLIFFSMRSLGVVMGFNFSPLKGVLHHLYPFPPTGRFPRAFRPVGFRAVRWAEYRTTHRLQTPRRSYGKQKDAYPVFLPDPIEKVFPSSAAPRPASQGLPVSRSAAPWYVRTHRQSASLLRYRSARLFFLNRVFRSRIRFAGRWMKYCLLWDSSRKW